MRCTRKKEVPAPIGERNRKPTLNGEGNSFPPQSRTRVKPKKFGGVFDGGIEEKDYRANDENRCV